MDALADRVSLLLFPGLFNSKIVIKLKGESPKLDGAVVNVPTDAKKTCNFFSTNEQVILTRLKKIMLMKPS